MYIVIKKLNCCRESISSGGRVGWLVEWVGSIPAPVRVSRCHWARRLTRTAPDELAVTLRGWHCRRCVNVCMKGWMTVNTVKRFGYKSTLDKSAILMRTFTICYNEFLYLFKFFHYGCCKKTFPRQFPSLLQIK